MYLLSVCTSSMDVNTTHILGSISSDKYAYIVWVSMDAYVPTIWQEKVLKTQTQTQNSNNT